MSRWSVGNHDGEWTIFEHTEDDTYTIAVIDCERTAHEIVSQHNCDVKRASALYDSLRELVMFVSKEVARTEAEAAAALNHMGVIGMARASSHQAQRTLRMMRTILRERGVGRLTYD